MIEITSLQNGRIKNIVKLNNRRQRDQQQVTVVEGVREVMRALQQGIVPCEAYICPDLLDDEGQTAVAHLSSLPADTTQHFSVTPDIFAKIAYRGQSGGLLIVIPYLQNSLAKLDHPTFVAVIESVEKPGNLGAILRTADAAGVDAVIICGQGTDIHNPNAIRASLGAIFSVPVVQEETATVIDWLKKQAIQIVATTPDAQRPLTAVDYTIPTAIIMGSEAHGLSDNWLNAADQQVIIPMHGIVDSLNLSVSTALLLYEVVRQRMN